MNVPTRPSRPLATVLQRLGPLLVLSLFACDRKGQPPAWQVKQSLAFADASLFGDAAGDGAGWDLAAVGDADHDGFGDILIGAPGQDQGGGDAGAAYLVRGPLQGQAQLGAIRRTLFVGEQAGTAAGTGVAGAGDTDGDDWMDFWISAPGYGEDSGAVYLVRGPVRDTEDLVLAEQLWRGEAPDDLLGACIERLGPLDGSGVSDLLVGAPGLNGSTLTSGGAYILPGEASDSPRVRSVRDAVARIDADTYDDVLGSAVASAGDVNGDGLADFLLGSPYNNHRETDGGLAYLFLGPVSGTHAVTEADGWLWGIAAGDQAGAAVASAGDVDGDGLDDLLVGAPGAAGDSPGSGMVSLFFGPATGITRLDVAQLRLQGEATGDRAGAALTQAGDMNLDGFADFAVGAPGRDGTDSGSGALYLLQGPLLGTWSLPEAGSLVQGEADYEAGVALATAGDLDLDGRPDLLVSAAHAGPRALGEGLVYVLLGQGL